MGLRLYEGMSIREITDYLFLADEPQPSDLIFVVGGQHLERAERGVALFHQQVAPWLMFAGGNKCASHEAAAERFRAFALSLGVPAEQILLEANSHNSLDHVLMSLPIIDHTVGLPSIRAITLVSAPHHMRRLKQVVAKHVPRHVALYCCPDERTDSNRENWWHTEEGRELVYRELEKVRRYAAQGEL